MTRTCVFLPNFQASKNLKRLYLSKYLIGISLIVIDLGTQNYYEKICEFLLPFKMLPNLLLIIFKNIFTTIISYFFSLY